MTITPRQLVKSAVGIGCGTGLGLFCWAVLDYGSGWALFIGAVGSFIGFALSLPGVSASRVAGATSGLIIGYDPVNGGDESGQQGTAQAPRNAAQPEAASPDPQREPRPWERPRR
jgi:hypothetical protein